MSFDHNHEGRASRYHYNKGCRHPDCKEADTLYRTKWRKGQTKMSAARKWALIEDQVTDWARDPSEENERKLKNRLRIAASGIEVGSNNNDSEEW